MNSYPSKISPIQITGHRRNEAQTNTSTPWLKYAEGEIGQVEFDPGDNPRITKYLLSTGVKGREITPWCAAYVNWSLQQAGIKGTNSASSLSCDDSNWGNKLSQPALGSIASIRHYNSKGQIKGGHVSFVTGMNYKTGSVILLSGNYADAVNNSAWKLSKVCSFRLPYGSKPNYNFPSSSLPNGPASYKITR